MIRRPPRSTLFPYRRSSDLQHCAVYDTHIAGYLRTADELFPDQITFALKKTGELRYGENPHQLAAFYARSEEHTSELQSRQYLVCRLLLEKKILLRILPPPI